MAHEQTKEVKGMSDNELSFEDRVRAQFAGAENVRPETIASALHLANGKGIRNYLRMSFPRPIEMKGSTWLLSNDEAMQTIEHFLSMRKREQK
jgi:hypothetical protein